MTINKFPVSGPIFTFASSAVEYFRIECDGTLILGSGITTTDEASQKFWEMVIASFPSITASAYHRGRVAGLREALEAVEPYTRASSLHNYGPGGLSRVEKAEIDTGVMISQDIQALITAADKLEAETP